MKRQGWSATIGLVFISTLTLLLNGCSTARTSPPQIALFGDSLSWEAQPYYDELAHAAGDVPHTYDTYGGTAICDWLTRMTEVEAQYHPTAVELEFSGNNLTPCMAGYELYSPQYYEKYRADTMSAIRIFTAGGARVFLVGAPITRAQKTVLDWQKLNMQYEEIAADDPAHVTYVDAGTAIELPGTPTPTPCRAWSTSRAPGQWWTGCTPTWSARPMARTSARMRRAATQGSSAGVRSTRPAPTGMPRQWSTH